MEFYEFKKLLQDHFSKITKNQFILFTTDTDKYQLWDKYLDSFPMGTNEIFRERREFDCSCCKHFVRSFGNVVVIENNQVKTIWGFKVDDSKYQHVIDILNKEIKSNPVNDVFVTKESAFGTDKNQELREDGNVHTWEHFRINLPDKFVTKSSKTEASIMAEFRDVKNVFQRSLQEISKDAIETVLDLISQNSLYKGQEWQSGLTKFLELHNQYNDLPNYKKNNFCWSKSVEVGGAIGKIRNHSIGVLLLDISNGIDLNEAVKKYESIVAPTNYKRPKAIFTKKMIEQAQQTIQELGFIESLSRRHATIEDITVNNILFANKDTLKRMTGNVFDELQNETVNASKKFDKVEEIPVEHFVSEILPRLTNIEVYLENRHVQNMVSIIAPTIKDGPSMFKWSNGFSWAYSGNITDSMKQRVKAAGGNIEGVLRFSLQWNDDGDNVNDFDAHCIEPNRNEIYYGDMENYSTTGILDVDMFAHTTDRNKIAVENITWTNINKMKEGTYHFFVHNFNHRGGRSGFSAEIEYDGQIHSFGYGKELKHNEKVTVAKIKFTRKGGIEFIESLPSSMASRTVWGIDTNQFYPVSVCMFSPNYWDGQSGIGHKHYFFIIGDCKNDEQPNGFFNEFLKEDLLKHKRVFEALGGKMRVEQSDNQLSGLGFSSTKRDSLVCKLEGHVNRTVKIMF